MRALKGNRKVIGGWRKDELCFVVVESSAKLSPVAVYIYIYSFIYIYI